jgi:hypothetical protein
MKTKTSDPFYTSLREFTELTRQLIRVGDPEHLKACFGLVNKLLKEGDMMVKNAIRDSYIPSLHQFLSECEFSTRITNLFPELLQEEYDKYIRETTITSDFSVFVICLN